MNSESAEGDGYDWI